MSRRIFMLFAVLVLVGAAGWAKPPIYVSFASDDFHEGPTFTGLGPEIHGKARVDLMLDQQGDFEGGVVIFPSWFTFDAKMVNYKVIPWGANFLHIWDFTGSFSFNHYDVVLGSPFLLGTKFENAVLTRGSATSWARRRSSPAASSRRSSRPRAASRARAATSRTATVPSVPEAGPLAVGKPLS